jgi:hypothetical protein
MKKITLVALAFGALSFASCKKAVTCSCTAETVDSGTNYIKEFVSVGVYQQDQEAYKNATEGETTTLEFDKVSKKFQNENCPKKVVTAESYDNTDTYQTDGTFKADRTGTILDGTKGTRTTTTTCEIKD